MSVLHAERSHTTAAGSSTCDSYGPGHQLHWTQWKAASSAPAFRVTRIIDHEDHFEFHIEGEPPLKWSHHEPDRLREALAAAEHIIEVCPRYRALRIDGHWFNCAPQELHITLCG